MKTGVVLEGGAMRGMYSAGVLDVFMEAGLRFDGLIGVSAGAIAGVSFVSGQQGRTIRYNTNYCRDKRMMSFYSLLTTGDLVGVDFCYHEIPERLDPFDHEAFRDSKTAFYVTCTDMETGEPAYIQLHDMGKEIDYLRASASMPFVSRIVEIDGRKYLDGGCSDSVPVRKFMELGYEKNVVILTRPADYWKSTGKAPLASIFYRKYPAFVRQMEQRIEKYNRLMEDIRLLEAEGKIFVIRPEWALEIGRMSHDPKRLLKVYERGRTDAAQKLDDLRRWLQE